MSEPGIVKRLDRLDTIGSTMDAARDRVRIGAFRPAGEPVFCAAVLAREQTNGRGQRGRRWYSAPGQSLSVTYALCRESITQSAASAGLGLLAGVATAEALNTYRWPVRAGLKWPNDIIFNGRKAGGVLVEMAAARGGAWIALIGAGLNVSISEMPPDLAPTATSLLLAGVSAADLPDLEDLAYRIGESLCAWALRYRPGGTASEILPDPELIGAWRALDATAGRRFETEIDGALRVGVAEGIDERGALLLRMEDGSLTAVRSATSLRDLDPLPPGP